MKNLVTVTPDDKKLHYTGRIEFSNPMEPVFVFPFTSVEFIFTGTGASVTVLNQHHFWDNYLGVVVDGEHRKIELDKSDEEQKIIVAEGLEMGKHHIKIFKCQDSCHLLKLVAVELSEGARLHEVEGIPERRMEFYGDSITAGEVSEAVAYEGMDDPQHTGQYSNCWYAYSTMTARALNAQAHLVAQGGIALLDNTGYFNAPNYLGMISSYDKVQYNPVFGKVTHWNFDKYTPHVVVVAIGQNDAHPYDFMKENYVGEKAAKWRLAYMAFIKKLRQSYPMATIVLKTTIMNHDKSWDRAISAVCSELKDEKIHYFAYRRNGIGTPGHLRINEAQEMADELTAFIDGLGEEIWQD